MFSAVLEIILEPDCLSLRGMDVSARDTFQGPQQALL